MNTSKNKLILLGVTVLVIGIAIGCLVCCGIMKKGGMDMARSEMNRQMPGMHMMPDGSMMHSMGGMQGSSMSGMMDDMMAGLQGKTGEEFDRAFLAEMIVHHEGAVVMAEAALKYAAHKELKDMAKEIIAAQTKEIAEMKAWQAEWSK